MIHLEKQGKLFMMATTCFIKVFNRNIYCCCAQFQIDKTKYSQFQFCPNTHEGISAASRLITANIGKRF